MWRTLLIALLWVGASGAAHADVSADLLRQWREAARTEGRQPVAFSAERGKTLYFARLTDWSCSTCHTRDPRSAGRHTVTQQPIKPLSPLANAERFTDAAKVEKWFRRNCKDVLRRECTAVEKGDLLTFLLSPSAKGQP